MALGLGVRGCRYIFPAPTKSSSSGSPASVLAARVASSFSTLTSLCSRSAVSMARSCRDMIPKRSSLLACQHGRRRSNVPPYREPRSHCPRWARDQHFPRLRGACFVLRFARARRPCWDWREGNTNRLALRQHGNASRSWLGPCHCLSNFWRALFDPFPLSLAHRVASSATILGDGVLNWGGLPWKDQPLGFLWSMISSLGVVSSQRRSRSN